MSLTRCAGYVYSGQLKALEEGSMCNPNGLPQEAWTTLNVEAWQKLLQSHPDEWFKKFILRGIEQGFYHGDQANLKSRPRNMVSAMERPVVVEKYLDEELA